MSSSNDVRRKARPTLSAFRAALKGQRGKSARPAECCQTAAIENCVCGRCRAKLSCRGVRKIFANSVLMRRVRFLAYEFRTVVLSYLVAAKQAGIGVCSAPVRPFAASGQCRRLGRPARKCWMRRMAAASRMVRPADFARLDARTRNSSIRLSRNGDARGRARERRRGR